MVVWEIIRDGLTCVINVFTTIVNRGGLFGTFIIVGWFVGLFALIFGPLLSHVGGISSTFKAGKSDSVKQTSNNFTATLDDGTKET